jgi:glycosyltransferase involved in cell wall biosynthesis
MNSKPISIAMATFNGSKYIEEQLYSILNQTIKPSEIIICDDNSTDGTFEILQKFAELDSTIKIFANNPGLGVTMNFNKALCLCTKEYTAMADQDDIWEPDKLEKQLRDIADFSNVPALSVHDLTTINSDGLVIEPSRWRCLGDNPEVPKHSLLFANKYNGCTMMFNNALKKLAVPFPPSVTIHDHWFVLNAFYLGKIITNQTQLIRYRRHGNNTNPLNNNIPIKEKIRKYFNHIFAKEHFKHEIALATAFLTKHKDLLDKKTQREIQSIVNLTDKIDIIRKINFSVKFRLSH